MRTGQIIGALRLSFAGGTAGCSPVVPLVPSKTVSNLAFELVLVQVFRSIFTSHEKLDSLLIA